MKAIHDDMLRAYMEEANAALSAKLAKGWPTVPEDQATCRVAYHRSVLDPWQHDYFDDAQVARCRFKRLRADGYYGSVQYKDTAQQWVSFD